MQLPPPPHFQYTSSQPRHRTGGVHCLVIQGLCSPPSPEQYSVPYCYAVLCVPKYSPSINKTLYCSLAIPYVLHLPFHCFAIQYCPHIIGHNGPTLSYGKDSFLCRITVRGVPLSALRPYLHRQFCKGGHVALKSASLFLLRSNANLGLKKRNCNPCALNF